MEETRNIHTRTYIEHAKGTVTITGDQVQQQVNAQQYAQAITSESSQADVAKLLTLIQQELSKLNLPQQKQVEIAAEIKTTEIQVKKAKPDKPKIADRLRGAATALKETGMLGMETVALGNAIGKAIVWCGEEWTQWGI